MRVQYTIPGWDPSMMIDAPSAPETASMFATKLREVSAVAPPPPSEILGLNLPIPGELSLTPPPRPQTMAFADIHETRRLWHKLLDRHALQPPEDPAEYQMLVLLAEMQRMEDYLTALSTIHSRG